MASGTARVIYTIRQTYRVMWLWLMETQMQMKQPPLLIRVGVNICQCSDIQYLFVHGALLCLC